MIYSFIAEPRFEFGCDKQGKEDTRSPHTRDNVLFDLRTAAEHKKSPRTFPFRISISDIVRNKSQR